MMNLFLLTFGKASTLLWSMPNIVRAVHCLAPPATPMTIDIMVWLTDLKKSIVTDTKTFNEREINSGFTHFVSDTKRNIVIYRKEECEKVLAHELCHALNMDISLYNNRNLTCHLNEKYCDQLPLLSETFTESMAIYITCALNSNQNWGKCQSNFKEQIQHSICTCQNIIHSGKKISASINHYHLFKTAIFLQQKTKSNVLGYLVKHHRDTGRFIDEHNSKDYIGHVLETSEKFGKSYINSHTKCKISNKMTMSTNLDSLAHFKKKTQLTINKI